MRPAGTARAVLIAAAALVIALAALVGSLCFGSAAIAPRDVILALVARIFPGSSAAMAADPVAITIVWELRLARTLLAGIAGACLGAAGATLQGLFRNPLADPYSLGVSSGAALGAVLAMAAGLRSPLGSGSGVQASAFVGALLSAALVYAVARAGRKTERERR